MRNSSKIDGDFYEGCLMWCLAIGLILAMMFIGPAIELWLWSAIVVPNFALPMLSYWEMFGLDFLIGLLFNTTRSSSIINAFTKD